MDVNFPDQKSELSIAGTSQNLSRIVHESEQKARIAKRLLDGARIGISISNGEDTNALGFSEMHQSDAMIEFARHVLVYGGSLVYGGDLRVGGYTELFSELSFQYRTRGDTTYSPFYNYFSYPIYLKLTKLSRSEFKKNRVEIIEVGYEGDVFVDQSELFNNENPKTRLIWATSLSKMREQANDNIHARIFIGGSNKDFKGACPGIVEEAVIAVKTEKPMYLIGAFGGASKRIIESIEDKKDCIDVEDEVYQTKSFIDFRNFYYAQGFENSTDYKEANRIIRNLTIDRISELNGLSKEENLRLFKTKHLSEMIFLVLKGLISVYR